MKCYLSSFKFGNEIATLKSMIPANNRVAYINNSRDHKAPDKERLALDLAELNELGFDAFHLDLKQYFGKTEQLSEKLAEIGALWVVGGNTFVLRQAMRLSGFDTLFASLVQRDDFLYGGYSAGICILGEDLRSIDHVDEPFIFPFAEITEPIYEGLGLFNYMILPHYDSDHPESQDIQKEVERCIEKKWLFKVLRDGEVIIFQKTPTCNTS